ncbi:MAG: ferrous iron transport protein B [Chloroflexi bacterium]|nr:MAG: ferrous iron transport protein B [Chloroflexota bacterium]HEY68741.1 ferrous iron transport protein B [Thermoflexia bacterium]
MTEKIHTVALAGQPNVGKSTLFNLLTGLNQHVGNWPGKTVERKEGTFTYNGRIYRLVDLPGTYSLTANSVEEVIARDFIIKERPDVVIVVADAATLERNLYLVAELLPLPAPVILALNMMDVAQQEGFRIEPEVLEAALGVRVVPMVATKNVGVHELLAAIDEVAHDMDDYAPKRPEVRADHQDVLAQIETLIEGYVPEPYPQDWVALKLLEGDREITQLMQEHLPEERWQSVYDILRQHDDAMVAVASGRYEWIGRMIRAAVTRPKVGQIGLTERLDRWATHPLWGLILLASILGLTFWLTYTIGAPLQELLDTYVVGNLAELARIRLAGGAPWLSALIVDGIIGGVGAVLTFLPILVIFFAVMGTLEDMGYMARAAYVMDGFMHLMGLHGKSFLPLFLGFGCNVPAVLGTRVIESRRARLLTIMLAPLIPCTARMAVVAFLAPAFFGSAATLVSWGLILLALVVLALSGVLINKTVFRGQRAAFIMELPLYHLPNWRTIGMLVWQRSLAFLKKAGTLILLVSVMVWALSMLPGGEIETSFLARIGRLMEPVGRLMGFDWRLMVALLTSFIAKENSIATLGVLFGADQEAGLAETLAATFSAPTALAFLVVQMLFIPCVATVAVIRQETGSWRWTLFSLGFLLLVSWVAGVGLFWLAHLVGL